MTQTLNARQEAFCRKVAGGESASRAYQQVYDASPATAEASASRLLGNVKVSARIRELQVASAQEAVMSLAEKRRLLREIALSELEKTSDRLKALELDGRFSGELASVKHAVELKEAAPEMKLTHEELMARARALGLPDKVFADEDFSDEYADS
jgi:hypothetical protein